ncbi:serine/threonine transporter [Legionella bononiensis]|uniref:HAAAP family serine/threonine permease n=1 Tax=Legionella bononiensis TaxID=2793102 RepID=A0ABS1WB77_9GAMM|nr:serine/threonine transporter [Legionella bononiensis]MBL7480238.1 HAAAP family serine/threonine permease [Legionella bononiensis]MBL7526530.1 HAAAP family serine/threonine permease [Legionella bononiensis]MBL7562976.1 HAAAP family serine/threonine permease [Legionella bononiensis]
MSLNESAAIVSPVSENKFSEWRKQDTVWMLSLYGTAIGAGTLFLPIDAGLNGILPLIIMTLLAFPMTYYSHRALCRFVLSGSSPHNDITEVVEEHFGSFAGRMLTGLYFFAIYPILLMYSVAITNTTESFIVNQMGFNAPPRALLAIVLILALMAIVRFGQDIIVKSMSLLVYPFATILLLLSLYLIPNWNNAILQQSNSLQANGGHGLLMTLWLIIPVMVFSFNHSPIISSFAVSQKQQYGNQADKRSSLIMKYSHLLMVFSVMFFVFSCVFSLSPQDLMQAKQQNISILSYLANHFNTPVIAYIAPVIAFIAISKSFLGHYLGAKEGMSGIIVKALKSSGKTISKSALQRVIEVFMILTCWVVATINPNILKMIETLGGPVIAILLFIMPMYAIARVPAMKKYSNHFSNVFITIMGIISISAIIYGLI